jgi:hypothetical protein
MIARPPAAAPRIAAPPRPAPRFVTPHRAAPHIATPRHRIAPNIQRAQSPNRAIIRAERREHRIWQRQQSARQPLVTQKNQAANLQQRQTQRLQQLQQQRRLSRTERRELRELRRAERVQQQSVQKQQTAAQSGQNRIEQLQQQRRLSRAERRELRQLQRAQQQQKQQQLAVQPQQQRARGTRVTPQQAMQSRFASRFLAGDQSSRRADRRAARLAARAAWRLGLFAAYVPWRGPIYWPYAYNDIFYYTFWPDAYEPGYWAYVYDDFFDGIFFPYGAPYVEYAYEGPYGDTIEARSTTGTAYSQRAPLPGRVSRATRDFCAEQAKGIAAWPFDRIARAVQPNGDQRETLENLKKAANEAAAELRDACPQAVPLTPPGRLQAMQSRLQATLDAVKFVRPALVAFYDSLSDEQKARFNELGPDLDRRGADRTGKAAEANCSGEKAGLSGLAIERIEQAVQPNDAQSKALDKLDGATQKAVDTLREACPTATALTPVGRLEAMQKRLEALIAAAKTVHPALDEFYASLSGEQKAKFNRLGRETASSGG